MRGAVLYRLGLKVHTRVMQRSYGMVIQRLFMDGDPVDKKVVGNNGLEYCPYIRWFVKKVWDQSAGLNLTILG